MPLTIRLRGHLKLVRAVGLEPTRNLIHGHLKTARLATSPRPQTDYKESNGNSDESLPHRNSTFRFTAMATGKCRRKPRSAHWRSQIALYVISQASEVWSLVGHPNSDAVLVRVMGLEPMQNLIYQSLRLARLATSPHARISQGASTAPFPHVGNVLHRRGSTSSNWSG